MAPQSSGLVIVLVGLAIVGIGLLVWSGALSWFGRLPGDIRIEGEHGGFFFPLTTCVVVSIVLSLIFWIFRR